MAGRARAPPARARAHVQALVKQTHASAPLVSAAVREALRVRLTETGALTHWRDDSALRNASVQRRRSRGGVAALWPRRCDD